MLTSSSFETLNALPLGTLEELRDQLAAEESFYEFHKQAWQYIEGDDVPFIDGWHIQAICDHLQAVFERVIKRLLINVPPRTCKSTITSVSFPAWVFMKRASERMLYSSYALSLAIRDSVRCRRLIMSPWYQRRWGDRFRLAKDQNTKSRIDTNCQGYRISTSTTSSLTGDGGTMLIIDDGNSAADRTSPVKLQGRIDWLQQVWSSRLSDKKNGCRIIVQQRIDQNDISGFIINKDEANEYTKLILPMEFDPKRKCSTIVLPSSNGQKWTDPRTENKQILWEHAITPKILEELKNGLGSVDIVNAQLQQDPTPSEGTLIKRHWFKLWNKPLPSFVFILQSWDLSLTPPNPKVTSSYSAATTWGVFYNEKGEENIMFLSLWRDKIEYPELRERVKRMYYNYTDTQNDKNPLNYDQFSIPKVDMCLVEAKAAGDPLMQDLRRANIVATPFIPKDNKITRVKLISHLIEAGTVWLPTKEPNYKYITKDAEILLDCVTNIHSINQHYDGSDVVDTMSQALIKLKDKSLVSSPKDFKWHDYSQPISNWR